MVSYPLLPFFYGGRGIAPGWEAFLSTAMPLPAPQGGGREGWRQGSGPMLALMMMGGEEREVDCFALGRVAGMVGMEIIPGELGKLLDSGERRCRNSRPLTAAGVWSGKSP